MTVQSVRPAFTLIDHNGHAVTDLDFHGKYSLVFFGFTNCAVVCPRALKRLSEVLMCLGPTADKINALYISVDPDRDMPEAMKGFLESFPQFTGLTGTKEQIDSARKAFRVFAQAKDDPNAPGGYVVPHTAITYLLGLDGRLLDHFNDALSAEDVCTRLRAKMMGGSDFTVNRGDKRPMNGGPMAGEQESLKLLDDKQVTTIRHIGNLARQLRGDWSNMMGAPHLNEGFGAYRYQLAYGYFALALAHFHRLPAAPGFFKDTMERLIKKMLDPDVWFYWHDVSKGGGTFNVPPSEGSFDPVMTDNIMYSAYLQTMSALYNSLFDDDRYQKPGGLTLEYNMYFWGPEGGCKFDYDQNSINERVYRNMVQEGYLGVACEPSCIFQICNQIPILGFRLNDALKGDTNVAEEVTQGYLKAWNETGGGILNEEGIFNTLYVKHIPKVMVLPSPSMEAWCGLMMHSWNHDLVQQTYDRQLERMLIHKDDGSLVVNVGEIGDQPPQMVHMTSGGAFGWLPAWAAEMGDEETKDRLLEYADKHFRPRIQNGGLTYPRNDTVFDTEGNFVMMTPIVSNAILPLARLNVRHGFKRLYDQPWGAKNRQHYTEPALAEVDFDVDVYRAVYVASSRTLIFDLAVHQEGLQGTVSLARVFGRSDWVLQRDGDKIAWGSNSKLAGSDSKSKVKQDGELLRLTIASTKVASFILQWTA